MKVGTKQKGILLCAVFLLTMLMGTACGNQAASGDNTQAGTKARAVQVNSLQGEINIEGSSTMFAATDAIAQEFNKAYPSITIDIGVAGTTSGFRKLIRNKLDICNASSPMSDTQKADSQEQGIEFIELKAAFDGIVIVVNKGNNWLTSITTDELAKIWSADSVAAKWSEINSKWPDTEIKLYAPDSERDFFCEVVNGDASNIRPDVISAEDGKSMAETIAADPNAMAIMSYEYYEENKEQVKALGLDAGKGIVQPTDASIKDLSYQPLSRQLYLYVNKKSLEREEVSKFLEFYFSKGTPLIGKNGIVPMADYNGEIAKLN